MSDDEKPIVRLSTPNTPNDLAIFAEQFTTVVAFGDTGWVQLNGGTIDVGVMRDSLDPQPMDCGCVPEWPTITPLMREVARLIDELHEIPGCGVGGPLHIVTDDPNYEDHSLNYCAQAVFDLPGERAQGWWREEQDARHSDLMERVCMAILWGLSSMTYNERAITAGYWPLPEDGSRDPNVTYCHGPEQEDYLYAVEWGYDCDGVAVDDDGEPVQPSWCCDQHWSDTMAMRERRMQPRPCVPPVCPPVQEVTVTSMTPPPSANPFGLWLPGEP